MDPKRKRIYIIMIVVCVLASIGVFWWGKKDTLPQSPQPTFMTNPATTAEAGGGGGPTGLHTAPAVFPASTILDTKVLDSTVFKILQSYPPSAVTPAELGRDDPFKNY
jgi:hypothetical protein